MYVGLPTLTLKNFGSLHIFVLDVGYTLDTATNFVRVKVVEVSALHEPEPLSLPPLEKQSQE